MLNLSISALPPFTKAGSRLLQFLSSGVANVPPSGGWGGIWEAVLFVVCLTLALLGEILWWSHSRPPITLRLISKDLGPEVCSCVLSFNFQTGDLPGPLPLLHYTVTGWGAWGLVQSELLARTLSIAYNFSRFYGLELLRSNSSNWTGHCFPDFSY